MNFLGKSVNNNVSNFKNKLLIKFNSIKVRTKFLKKYISSVDSRKSAIRLAFNKSTPNLHFLAEIEPTNPTKLFNLLNRSKSQIFQDLFVINEVNYLRNGYFVEFGAFDGLTDSNTLFLEKCFDWQGILAEPSKEFFPKLKSNRKNNSLDNRAVYSKTGVNILFNETALSSLSTIDLFSDSDGWDRSNGIKYYVETISLHELLIQNNAPKRINYLSIDTEGSEFEILNSFDFESFEIDIITVEHNFNDSRSKIFNLLVSKGYSRKYERISSFDDWYVHERIKSDLIM
jgi:FkbM family methyltransferase